MGATFTPKQRNWKWFANDASEPSSQLANEITKPTLTDDSEIRLRLDITDTGGKAANNIVIDLEYSTNESSWDAFGAANHWDYADGLATEGNLVTTFKLTGPDTAGEYSESAGGSGGYDFGAGSSVEFDFCIQPTANVSPTTTYFFRAKIAGAEVPLDTSEAHPQVLTAGGNVTVSATTPFGSLSAVAASIVTAAVISLGVLSGSFSLPSPSIGVNHTEHANIQVISASQPSLSILTDVVLSVSPQDVTASLPTLGVKTDSVIIAGAGVGTFSQPAAIISLGVSASASVQSVTVESLSPEIQTDSTVSPSAGTITASQLSPDILFGCTVPATQQDVALSLPSLTVNTGVQLSVVAQAGTFSVPAASALSSGAVTASAAVAPVTAEVPPPSIITDQVITLDEQGVTFSLPVPSVITDQIVAVSGQDSTFSLPVTTIITNQVIAVGEQGVTFSLPVPSITTDQVIAVGEMEATFSLPVPTIVVQAAENVTAEVADVSVTVSLPGLSVNTAATIELPTPTISASGPTTTALTAAVSITVDLPALSVSCGTVYEAVCAGIVSSVPAVTIKSGVLFLGSAQVVTVSLPAITINVTQSERLDSIITTSDLEYKAGIDNSMSLIGQIIREIILKSTITL